ncbi:phosphoribosylaminoimidazolecarboxamide formyltransferase/IMP cyclohydrolase [Tuber brumale]|nr:phosphoribosylaminoimidazolecarboxamide formyltransferase/IMP cyclohydrolase [Tuber brumale]
MAAQFDRLTHNPLYNKAGLLYLGRGLAQNGVRILASGGTATLIRGAGMSADITNAPETLDGKLKTLHPAHSDCFTDTISILAWGLELDEKDLAEQNIGKVNYVACNLWPFKDAIAEINVKVFEAIEKIRYRRSNSSPCSSKESLPCHYSLWHRWLCPFSGGNQKRWCFSGSEEAVCSKRFLAYCTANYDSAIARFFRRRYAGDDQQQLDLHYGENSRQNPAQAFVKSGELPIKRKESLSLPATASFKHVFPRGTVVGIALPAVGKTMCVVDDIKGLDQSPLAWDWIALGDTVDVTTAKIISREVSDGVIAPVTVKPQLQPPTIETRQAYGELLLQKLSQAKISTRTFSRVLTPSTNYGIPPPVLIDLIVATIALKCQYTQSNPVCYAKNGKTIGFGAGQQSRIYCTRLAGDKAHKWWLRATSERPRHQMQERTKRPSESNAIVLYVSGHSPKLGDGIDTEEDEKVFDEVPEPFTPEESEDGRNQQAEVAISSDGLFPFVDNVFRAYESGAKYRSTVHGGSGDYKWGIVFAEAETRLSHHEMKGG